jgi:hypothetical protein
MCMSCVAQATPMITVGFGVLRRDALRAWLRRSGTRLGLSRTSQVTGGPASSSRAGPGR